MSNSPEFRFSRLVASNITQRPQRNTATIVAFAIIAAMLFSAQYLTSGALQSLDAGMTRMGADILVVPEGYNAVAQTVILMGEPSTFFFNDSGFEQIVKIPGVSKASPQIFVATLSGQACCSAPVQIIAIDPEHDFTVATWLKENPGVIDGEGRYYCRKHNNRGYWFRSPVLWSYLSYCRKTRKNRHDGY